jgi:hypothetical protein
MIIMVVNINNSIRIITSEFSKSVDAAVNKSGEDFRSVLGVKNMVDGVSSPSEYAADHVIDFNSYQQVSSQDEGGRFNHTRGSRDVIDNDTTAESEFQSPLRTSQLYYSDSNLPATAPRYSSIQAPAGANIPADSRVRGLVPCVGGRLNISSIPTVDSGSDGSSPNASTPSDEEKESSRNDSKRRGEWRSQHDLISQIIHRNICDFWDDNDHFYSSFMKTYFCISDHLLMF